MNASAGGAIERETLVLGDLGVNCYLLALRPADGARAADAADAAVPCVVIDPGADPERIAAVLDRRGWRPEAMLLTHAHYDHICAITALRAHYPGVRLLAGAETSRRAGDPRTNLSVFANAPVRVAAADVTVEDGREFTAAGIVFEPTEVPGHDPGEMAYGIRETGWLFTGDVLFAGSVGRSDFPGGDHGALVAGVKALLAKWPADAIVLPGHGPESTVAHELRHNPYL